MILRAAGAALCLFMAGGVVAQDLPGKAIFQRNCGPCHAAGTDHPGTMRLAQSRGATKAVLEQRSDLDPGYIRYVVRHGLIEMPPWRPTELDDAALEQLVQYLAPRRK